MNDKDEVARKAKKMLKSKNELMINKIDCGMHFCEITPAGRKAIAFGSP